MFAELRNRVVLVTGAASGIGDGVSDAFQSEGAVVVRADTAYPRGSLRRRPTGAEVHLDVTDEEEVAEVLEQIESAFGLVEVLVHAAGTSTMAFGVDTTEAEWDLNLDVNAKGSFLVAKHVAGRLRRADRTGSLVLIASQAGKNGYRGMTAYVASKHAVLGLTRTLAVELAPRGIRVNAICPGIIETRMKHRERVEGAALRGMTVAEIEAEDRSQVPLGRTGTPRDVAGVALFLASDLSAYMTGQSINVTGGITMH